MALSKTAIVQGLQGIVGGANVITDEKELQQSSMRPPALSMRTCMASFTRPIPAAVVMARSTQHVAEVLKYANRSRINVVARTGRTATEGGLETAVANSIVLDGSGYERHLKIDAYNMQATVQLRPCACRRSRTRSQARPHDRTRRSRKPIAQIGRPGRRRAASPVSRRSMAASKTWSFGLEAVFADGTITRIKNVPRRCRGS